MTPSGRGVMTGDGPVGIIDIGSNSVRLVVYERLARSPTPFFNEKILAGLGRSVAETGLLEKEPVRRTEAALKRFRALADQMSVRHLDVLATAAVREAENGAEFIAMAESVCGVAMRVLTGEEEANLAGLGVVSGIPGADGLCGDLGGGSLELVGIKKGSISVGETFPLGGLRLQHSAGGEMKAARRIVRSELKQSELLGKLEGREFYAIGGTWRSLAKLHMQTIDYPLHVMQYYTIEAEELLEFLKPLARDDTSGIVSMDAVSRQRQALLPYGAAVLADVIQTGKPKRVILSALGLREGFLYSQLSDAQKAEDPLLSAAAELAELRSRSLDHAWELIHWTAGAMEAVGVEETAEESRLRSAACLLADIGWRAHPDYRGEQSLNIIANAGFVGLDHPGRAYLAMAVYYRHSGLSETELAPAIHGLASERYRERARTLAAIFRVAYLVSASMPGVISRTRLVRSGKVLTLQFPPELEMLAGGRLERRLKQLAGLCGLTAEMATEPSRDED